MASKSKVKGKNGEREVCKYFSKIFGGSWQRTFTSGAFTGMKNKWRVDVLSKSQLLNNTNDVVPPDEFPNCAIEVKSYNSFDFHLLYRKDGNKIINSWIDQVYNSGIDLEKSFPIICMKFNRIGWFCCVFENKINDLNYNILNYTKFNYKNNNYYIFGLEEFIETFKNELKLKFSN